ncbi:hypothetical protein CUMW_234470, partial [Citrus unshiu]
MEALAKIGAACNSLLQYDLEELGALVTTEAYCNFSNQEFSAVKVACRLFRVRCKNSNEDRQPILAGKLSNLFSTRFILVKEDREPILAGKLRKLFPRRFNSFNEDRQPISCGIS